VGSWWSFAKTLVDRKEEYVDNRRREGIEKEVGMKEEQKDAVFLIFQIRSLLDRVEKRAASLKAAEEVEQQEARFELIGDLRRERRLIDHCWMKVQERLLSSSFRRSQSGREALLVPNAD